MMTAVLVSVFLLVVGMGFLYFMERDSYLQLTADRQARANYLARAGVEFFCFCKELTPAGQVNQSPDIGGALQPMTPGHFQQINFGPKEIVNVTVSSTGVGCKSEAFIFGDLNQVVAKAQMVVSDSHLATKYLPVQGVSDGHLR